MYNSSKLVDGYGITDSYETSWVDVRSYDSFSMSVVFTGDSPQGTLQLKQSNDRQWSGGNSVKPLLSVPADNSSGNTKVIDDSANVPSGYGISSASVNGAGAYVLDQRLVPFAWVKLVYTASSSVSTQLDVFLTVKNHQ